MALLSDVIDTTGTRLPWSYVVYQFWSHESIGRPEFLPNQHLGLSRQLGSWGVLRGEVTVQIRGDPERVTGTKWRRGATLSRSSAARPGDPEYIGSSHLTGWPSWSIRHTISARDTLEWHDQ